MGGKDINFPNKVQGKKVSWWMFSNQANTYPMPFTMHLKKDPYWLDCKRHYDVTLLGIFSRRLGDHTDFFLPIQRPDF